MNIVSTAPATNVTTTATTTTFYSVITIDTTATTCTTAVSKSTATAATSVLFHTRRPVVFRSVCIYFFRAFQDMGLGKHQEALAERGSASFVLDYGTFGG